MTYHSHPQDRTEWLAAIARAVHIRDRLRLSERQRFDDALRPRTVTDEGASHIDYPDAIWHITRADVDRAEAIADGPGD